MSVYSKLKRLLEIVSRVGAEDRIAFSNILSSMHDCQTRMTARSRTPGYPQSIHL
jgi:hypothetical protein